MKKIVRLCFVLALLLITAQLAFTYSGSAPPSGYTNAPGESDCTSCHSSFPLTTSGTLYNNVTLTSSVPLTSFQPNTTYTLNLSFSNPLSTKYGFELVALPSSATASSVSVGTLTATSTETEVNTVSGRQYMSHSSSGTSATTNSKTWSFNWTTPAAFTGGVKFFVVVNSTNNDGSTGGDQIIAKVFSSNVLPVKWLSYGVTSSTNGNTIDWSTACETDNDHFEIEKSGDASKWQSIAIVPSKGNGNKVTNYTYEDITNFIGKSFYRIKQVDYNGNFVYSKVLILDNEKEAEWVQYDAEQKIIRISNTTQIAAVSLYTLSGNPVAQSEDGTQLNVTGLEKGIYLLQLPSGNYRKIFIY